jgi:hypothetical protein
VVDDVVFHEFGHQTVDASACGRQALKNLGAWLVFTEPPEDGLHLPDDFLGAVRQTQFFS